MDRPPKIIVDLHLGFSGDFLHSKVKLTRCVAFAVCANKNVDFASSQLSTLQARCSVVSSTRQSLLEDFMKLLVERVDLPPSPNPNCWDETRCKTTSPFQNLVSSTRRRDRFYKRADVETGALSATKQPTKMPKCTRLGTGWMLLLNESLAF